MIRTLLDRELGIDREITRRDFFYGSSLLAGSLLAGCNPAGDFAPAAGQDYGFDVGADWYGPGGFGDYAKSHGNTPGLIRTAHDIRAGRFDAATASVAASSEVFDLVIVGGGFAGLSAAHHFHRLKPTGRALLLDNHPIFGGEAKRNDFNVNGVHISGPQGSNDFAVQRETGDPDDYFTALNLPREFEFLEPGGAAAGMRIPLDNYDYLHWNQGRYDVGHYFGHGKTPWVRDPWESGLADTPWSEDVQQAFRRLWQMETAAPPGREIGPWLDSMTLKDCYEKVLGMPPEVSAYYDPIMASIIGLGCDAIAAHWGSLFRHAGLQAAAGIRRPAPDEFSRRQRRDCPAFRQEVQSGCHRRNLIRGNHFRQAHIRRAGSRRQAGPDPPQLDRGRRTTSQRPGHGHLRERRRTA
jgi:spermidine dehydrogenase